MEQGRFADIGKTNNASLQVVARTAQEDLLLNSVLLRRHLGSTTSLSVGASGEIYDGATRHAGRGKREEKGRASCGGDKSAGERSEGMREEGRGRRGGGLGLGTSREVSSNKQ